MNDTTVEIANKLLNIITNMENKHFREEIIIDQIKRELKKIIEQPVNVKNPINDGPQNT